MIRFAERSLRRGRSAIWSQNFASLRLTLIAAVLYLTLFVVFVGVLQFNMFQGDVAAYWRWSLSWRSPFSTTWAPGYPLAIAFLRTITFDSLPPLAVMWPITATFYLVSVNVAYRLLCELSVPKAFGFALLYAVFPFVSLMGAVYPTSDSMAMAFFLLAALAFARNHWLAFGIYGALALLTHKALWFSLLPLLAIAFGRHRASRPFVLGSLVPLALLWAAGVVYHGDAFWMVATSARRLMWSPGALPAFDGLVTSLLSGSAVKTLKGTAVLALFLLAAVLLYKSVRYRFGMGVAVCVSTLAMTVVLNQHEVWAVVRFGRLLLIPVAYFVAHGSGLQAYWISRALACSVALGVLTNFGFAVYTTAYYRGQAEMTDGKALRVASSHFLSSMPYSAKECAQVRIPRWP